MIAAILEEAAKKQASSAFNIFRYMGDFCHLGSKIILILSCHFLRSSEGISLSTQCLYLLVFLTRYIDVLWNRKYLYNTIFKIIYIVSSMYIIFLQTHVFRAAFSEQWRGVRYILIFSTATALFCCVFWDGFRYLLWAFSLTLESVAVIPQLALLTKLQIPTVISSYYLISLGAYRAFYVLNWIYRLFSDGAFDPTPVIFGVLQTYLYAEFFWIYYRRQSIKLTSSEGMLDEEDLKGGWLLGRVILGGTGGSDWGAFEQISAIFGRGNNNRSQPSRGLSVRADDTLERGEAGHNSNRFEDEPGDDVDSDAGVLGYEDEEEEEESENDDIGTQRRD